LFFEYFFGYCKNKCGDLYEKFSKTIMHLRIYYIFRRLFAYKSHKSNELRIGIVLRLNIRRLMKLSLGFEATLKTLYKKPLHFKVVNAEGDPTLLRALLMQLRDENYTLIVPVATATTEMAASLIQHQPIIGLAAEYSAKPRQMHKPCNIDLVDDELNKEQIIAFIHTAFPELKNLTYL